jgi:hypothetical protein
MLDKFMEKMMESAASAYLPRVEEKARARKSELEEIKMKVRTNPEQVNHERCDGRDLNPGYQIGNLMS